MVDIINNLTGVAQEQIEQSGFYEAVKHIFLWSSIVINWTTNKLTELGVPLTSTQLKLIAIVLDLIAIVLVWKYVVKPSLKYIIVLFLFWIFIGFFY